MSEKLIDSDFSEEKGAGLLSVGRYDEAVEAFMSTKIGRDWMIGMLSKQGVEVTADNIISILEHYKATYRHDLDEYLPGCQVVDREALISVLTDLLARIHQIGVQVANVVLPETA